MLFSKPFPDELAITHLYRNWALNNIKGSRTHVRSAAFAKATRSQRPSDFPHPWTELYLHQIMAHFSGMTEQTYRARHTMMALTSNWHRIYSDRPVKHSKTDVYAIGQFHQDSAASAHPFRLCLQCQAEDLRSYAMTYWHCEHHIAGIDVCPKHQTPLEQLTWQHAYSAPNPATLRGEPPSEALFLAAAHPILTRYQEIALRVMRHPTHVRYIYAHEHLLKQATEMGLCKRELSYSGTYYYPKHTIPQYILSHLPKAWLYQHFVANFVDEKYVPPGYGKDSHLFDPEPLQYPGRAKPIVLLLALAALFETTEEICALLFEQFVDPSSQKAVIKACETRDC